ncbi:nucleotide-sugar transporter [Rickenella mellea]|uniref:Nucleotide-sugar transporter n=1 Tax=Rickenella mellea TaxID=50990 RepID=A0A4Y7PMZ0_9AGAM|nr:nucleotide-sugar transporter [Rickenella mellea]
MAEHDSTIAYHKLEDLGSAGLCSSASADVDTTPRVFGMPLKYVSLVTLAVQNAAVVLIMHYSRVSTPSNKKYSAATAVLLTELLKGLISFFIAYCRVDEHGSRTQPPLQQDFPRQSVNSGFLERFWRILAGTVERLGRMRREVFSPDCWKLSIPAVLYVISNNLSFIAASNLSAATYQVTYKMKILTTAFFSVLLLRRQISRMKWAALFALALGIGIVQIQSEEPSTATAGSGALGIRSRIMEGARDMQHLKGLTAVLFACITSPLAGVYFEMVLKGSHADLWVRNVQLSLFSILPALLPVFLSPSSFTSPSSLTSQLTWTNPFANFTASAYLTVFAQVFGGLLTAVVVKHADSILKAIATSVSIILAFLVGMVVFEEKATVGFVCGATVVLLSTWVYTVGESRQGRTWQLVGRISTCIGSRKSEDVSIGTRDPTNSTSSSPSDSSPPCMAYANRCSVDMFDNWSQPLTFWIPFTHIPSIRLPDDSADADPRDEKA